MNVLQEFGRIEGKRYKFNEKNEDIAQQWTKCREQNFHFILKLLWNYKHKGSSVFHIQFHTKGEWYW